MHRTTSEIAIELLRAIERADLEAYSNLIADEIVTVFPFAPPGLPGRCEGRKECVENIAAVGKMLTRLVFLDLECFPGADDPEIVFVRGRSDALTSRGVPYSNEYCFLFRIRNGLVYEHHEYFDPLRILAAFSSELAAPR